MMDFRRGMPDSSAPRRWTLHRAASHRRGSEDVELQEPGDAATRARHVAPVGTPFLMSPDFHYDIDLNSFFYSADMLRSRELTRIGYARDIAAFLNFLHIGRGGCNWRDADAEDHRAYFAWRRVDARGARVSASTWDRELAAVNRFYKWATRRGLVATSPVPQRVNRSRRGYSISREPEYTPATRSHGARRSRVRWLPASSYRTWRDVGLRGYLPSGMPDKNFRGRWSARNSTFADLLIRTGMRLNEGATLLLAEIPPPDGSSGYQQFYLSPSVAKGGSERWISVPTSILREIRAYIEIDRPAAVAAARNAGRYQLGPDSLVLDAERQIAFAHQGNVAIKLSLLTSGERRNLFIESREGLEPASLWLSENGEPMAVSSWKDIFRRANSRCASFELDIAASPHMLRHSYAVITLEHLQRGHIAALASKNLAQRSHYVRTFGDPLDWLRVRMGHRSRETTQIYLHALSGLEMETRMALVPAEWDEAPAQTHDLGSD